jgi:hypothetical protein
VARRSAAKAARGKSAAALTVRPGDMWQEQPPPVLLPRPAVIELTLPDADPPALASEVPMPLPFELPPPDVPLPMPLPLLEPLAPAARGAAFFHGSAIRLIAGPQGRRISTS